MTFVEVWFDECSKSDPYSTGKEMSGLVEIDTPVEGSLCGAWLELSGNNLAILGLQQYSERPSVSIESTSNDLA